CWKGKGSNETQSKNDACSTKRKPYKLKPDEPVAPVNHAAISRNLSDDGQPYHGTEQSLLDLMEGRIDLLVRPFRRHCRRSSKAPSARLR
ncbi:MAG: hypothetical protein WBE14_03740, partial [Xanthobacteraceae bacterium]